MTDSKSGPLHSTLKVGCGLVLATSLLALSLRYFKRKGSQAVSATQLQQVASLITKIKDFPEKGVVFYDIFPILRQPSATHVLVGALVEHLKNKHPTIDAVVGLESRGFLFGPLVASQLHCAFVPIRKKGKLSGPVHSASYSKEYGSDTVELQQAGLVDGQEIILLDDLLATGGTMSAAVQVCRKAQAKILECIFVIELKDLRGRAKLESIGVSVWPVFQL